MIGVGGLAIVLSLGSAVAAAVEKIWHRSNLREVAVTEGYTFVFQLACFALSIPLGIIGALRSHLSWESFVASAVAGLFWGAYAWFSNRADAKLEVAISTTVSRFRIFLTWGFGIFVLSEQSKPLQLVGGILVAVAPALVYVTGRGQKKPSLLGLGYAIGGSVCSVCAMLCDKVAIDHGFDPLLTTCVSFGNGALLMVPLAFRVRNSGKGLSLPVSIRRLVVLACVSVFSYILLMVAFQHGEYSIVMPVYYVSPVIATILAMIFLRERDSAVTRLLAVCVATAGVCLIAGS